MSDFNEDIEVNIPVELVLGFDGEVERQFNIDSVTTEYSISTGNFSARCLSYCRSSGVHYAGEVILFDENACANIENAQQIFDALQYVYDNNCNSKNKEVQDKITSILEGNQRIAE